MAEWRTVLDTAHCTLDERAIEYLPMAYAVALRLSGNRRQAELIARKTIEELSVNSSAASLKMKTLSLVRANFLSLCGAPPDKASDWHRSFIQGRPTN